MIRKRQHIPQRESLRAYNHRRYLIQRGRANAYIRFYEGAEAAAEAAGLE